ncbi:MAG: ATP-dependent DNA helicase, partial [Advenella sp.]
DFQKQFVETLIPLIQASPGGVLVLCTTLRAVDNISAMLLEAFDTHFIERAVLRQGESSRGILLAQFRQLKNAVLVGSASFWEGIDLPGEMLTLVAIDKLPFAPPDDPVLEARIKACRESGGNPFFEFQLPSAAIALKQGAGRLIRTEQDWGLLVVGDRRLVEKPYGKLLWRGLPPFRRTRKLEEAAAFLKTHASDIAVPAQIDNVSE